MPRNHAIAILMAVTFGVIGLAWAAEDYRGAQKVQGPEPEGNTSVTRPMQVGAVTWDAGVVGLRATRSGTLYQGPLNLDTQSCLETYCVTGGDAGCLSPATGESYALTVTSEAAIRLRNGALTTYGGTGEIINAGAMLQPQVARPSPDGGATLWCCASRSDDAGPPTLQACKVP